MTEEAREPTARYAASKDPEYGTPWLLRFTNGQSTKIADFHYHDDCEFVARSLNDHLAPEQRESWGALRFMLQEANEERDQLAAENARLREAVLFLAGGVEMGKWNLGMFWMLAERGHEGCIVPPHIVALQDAIYREGGE